MDKATQERFQWILERAAESGQWGHLKGSDSYDQLTTQFDPNVLKRWISCDLESEEPNYSADRHVKHMERMHQHIFAKAFEYYVASLRRIYPDMDIDRYRDVIAMAISSSILDYQLVASLTDTVRVLDYSAGYGRNLPVFCQNPHIKYIATDSIPMSMASFDCFNNGHFNQTIGTEVNWAEALESMSPLYVQHANLHNLPDKSICTMMLIWCFSEMDKDSAERALRNICRLVRDRGFVIVRDNPVGNVHTMDIDRELSKAGFKLVHVSDDPYSDAYCNCGIMRVYRRGMPMGKLRTVKRNLTQCLWYKAYWLSVWQ